MLKRSLYAVIALSSLLTLACQSRQDSNAIQTQDAAQLRPLNANERAEDFDQLINLFKDYYGPYDYKQNLLKINIEQMGADLKAKASTAKTDEEFAGYVMQFAAALKDGHVQISIENTASKISAYKVPILIAPFENRAIIMDIDPSLKTFLNVAVGDEVLEIDGKSPFDYLPTILKYRSMARDYSSQVFLAYTLSRPSYITELIPTSPTVRLKFKTADGLIQMSEIPWVTVKYNSDMDNLMQNGVGGPLDLNVPFAQEYNNIVDNHIKQMGQTDPIFVNALTQNLFKFVKVYPSLATRQKYGLKDTQTPPIYAALYKFAGRTILLVRQATYSPADYPAEVYLRAYMALFDEYQDLADVMVLDQTHNPGGSYCGDFYNLFARPGDVSAVETPRADRKWINELQAPQTPTGAAAGATIGWDVRQVEQWGLLIEKAYDQGQLLADPIPLFTSSFYAQPFTTTWKKPMLVLIDELAGSCGDMFPMLVKANQRAKLFGQNTMGLGGNVEEVGVLNNSRIHIRLTRGLFYPYNPNRGPTPAEYIENNGIAPDYPWTHTVEDFRSGYYKYVLNFSKKAVEQIPASEPAN